MGFQTTGGHKIQSDRCCILFHPKSGMIQHVHRVITYVGAEETPAKRKTSRASAKRRR